MGQNKSKLGMGVDVSKDTLDIYWQEKSYKIKNDTDSISAFIKAEIEDYSPVFCVMESTGGYERTLVETLSTAGISFHVAHPSRIHAFGKAIGHFAKTDKLDAILLQKYAEFVCDQEKGDVILDPAHLEIIALRRLSRSLEDNLHAALCRLKQMPVVCQNHLKTEIIFYKKQISEIQEKISEKVEKHPGLKEKKDIMITMKGAGEKTAEILLAELPKLGNLSKKQVASLVGVAPKTYQSGKKSLSGHIFGGRFYARKALYMVALVASQHDLVAKARYKQLLDKGKAKKVALVALMRDAIVSLNAMIKKRQSCAFSS